MKLCSIKNNSNTIKLTVHTSCYFGFLNTNLGSINAIWGLFDCQNFCYEIGSCKYRCLVVKHWCLTFKCGHLAFMILTPGEHDLSTIGPAS